MKRFSLAILFGALVARAAVDLAGDIPEITLKDGRVLKQVRIVMYAEQAVVARWEGGRGTLAYQDLPDPVLAAIEQAHLRPGAKTPPSPPPPGPIPVPARPRPEATQTPMLASDLPPGAQITLLGRREGNQLYLQVVIGANGKKYPCECLVDPAETYTTVDIRQVPLMPVGHHDLVTVNGPVRIPYANAAVTAGALTKGVGVALSTNLPVNLLGANFFEGFLYTIDLDNAAIYLVKR
ncbi:MAG: hypothetical protein JSR48_08785 [Verrucomicrobia bacterium]|nr:hypothetical protein [Verrucomicrobiota bacterium]